jgi:hypothetical protein
MLKSEPIDGAASVGGATSPPWDGRVMTPLSKAEQNRKEAAKFSELAKTASSPFLRAYYWHTALRYLSSQGELSLAQSDSRTRILSAEVPPASTSPEVASVDGEPPISPTTLEKEFEQQNDQASLAAVNQQTPRASESPEEAWDRHTLEALKQLYRELHPLYMPAKNS